MINSGALCKILTSCDNRPRHRDHFICDEESHFYSQCLDKFLFGTARAEPQTIAEFGSGDGKPVISCLQRSSFEGKIHGFELNPIGARLAMAMAQERNVARSYKVLQWLPHGCSASSVRMLTVSPQDCVRAHNVCHCSTAVQVHNSCFFKGIQAGSVAADATCLIANPPYIPAPDNRILLPELHGGTDGSNLTRVWLPHAAFKTVQIGTFSSSLH